MSPEETVEIGLVADNPRGLAPSLSHARALGLRDEDLVPGELNTRFAGGGDYRRLKLRAQKIPFALCSSRT